MNLYDPFPQPGIFERAEIPVRWLAETCCVAGRWLIDHGCHPYLAVAVVVWLYASVLLSPIVLLKRLGLYRKRGEKC